MAFVIPAVAAFAAAGGTVAGVAAALTGAAGFATFATVAGGFMASAGMLTGNKTLTKVGSYLGIAGAVTGIASSLAEGASSAWAGTGEAAGTEAGLAESAAGSDAAQFGKYAKTPGADVVGQAGANAGQQAGSQAGQLAAEATNATGGSALTLNADPYLSALDQPGQNLLEQARLTKALPVQDAGMSTLVDGSDYGLMTRNAATPSGLTQGLQDSALSRIAEAGQQIPNRTALDTILDKIGGVGRWVKDNKELVQVGGQMLGSGMQSYQQGQQFDAQMNLLNQRRARLNQPVALGIQPPQLKMITPGG